MGRKFYIFAATNKEAFVQRNLTAVIATLLLACPFPAAADLVKKTSSGICHPPASSYFDRTKNYQAFDKVEACLASGGRLPKGMSGYRDNSESASRPLAKADSRYERSKFGHGWDDADGDCQNSRAEALIAQSSTKVRFADERLCRVVTGRWISPFTGKVIQNASEIDIDHVVPLKWAWDHGANTWSDGKRERFANDPVNLWSVELSLNRQKGAQGPEEWLPPAGKCQYVSRFVRIVKVYGLKPSQGEFNRYKQQLAEYCG
ncbi:HNH endonuclease family protein [Marinobacter adhaerens]|nr:HNH endonuclease family protein [Marinobacter adhaerens]MBW4979558.1 HNH endonuclease family protein [Marinobacter adhaerens]QWV15022.1 HNH endonuclease family protein [Marinobacter adhaerens]